MYDIQDSIPFPSISSSLLIVLKLFGFATLRLGTGLRALCLCFCLLRGVCLSHEDRSMKRFSDVVPFYVFWCDKL